MFILGSIILTWLLVGLTRPLFKKYFLTEPDKRSINQSYLPQGTGILFALVGSYFAYIQGSIVPTICLLIAFIGLIDDRYKLPIVIRYIAQFLTLILLMYSQDIFSKLFFSNINLNIILYFLIIISGTAFINFTNFMDGIDGLVSSSFIIIFLFIFSFTYPQLLIVAASLVGFLPWNINPAKVFMGDAGSTFLGAIYVSSLFSCKNYNQMFFVLFIASPLLGDALICVLRRAYFKQNIFKAHKLHLYQRLCTGGMSHNKVTFLYCLAIFLLGISSLFGNIKITIFIVFLEFLIAIWLDKKIASPFDLSIKNNS